MKNILLVTLLLLCSCTKNRYANYEDFVKAQEYCSKISVAGIRYNRVVGNGWGHNFCTYQEINSVRWPQYFQVPESVYNQNDQN